VSVIKEAKENLMTLNEIVKTAAKMSTEQKDALNKGKQKLIQAHPGKKLGPALTAEKKLDKISESYRAGALARINEMYGTELK